MPSEPESTAARTRTVTWKDPMPVAQAATAMTGLEFLQAVSQGELSLPPMLALMGIGDMKVEVGRVIFAAEPAEYHYNPIGVAHGGLACTLADSAMGCAVHSMLPAGVSYTTLEVKVNFVRPLTKDIGRITCVGTVIHVGSRLGTAEARVLDSDGKLYAHATTTCMIFRPPGSE